MHSNSVALLKRQFEQKKMRNSHYSLRTFAARLGVSSGALSEILKGKRDLSTKQKLKIVDKLELSPEERQTFLNEQVEAHLKVAQEEAYLLSEDEFHLISDWWHFALLNLISTKGFQPKMSWLSKRLGLSRDLVKGAWERLIRLGHVQKNASGQIVRKHPRLKTTVDIVNLSLKRSHLKDLELIDNALLNVPIDLRHTSSMTFSVERKDITKIKKAITNFHQEIMDLYDSKQGDDVYRVSVSLFPLTVIEEESVK